MILKILIAFFIPTVIGFILLWLAYNKIRNLEKLNRALWQDRGKIVKSIKELEEAKRRLEETEL